MWRSSMGCIVILALSILVAPLAADAPQPANVPRIGFLAGGTGAGPARVFEAFRQGLREHGYREGQNIVIEFRVAEGRAERLPDLAADLVHRKVDVIVTSGPQPIRAVTQATTTIPIVMAIGTDPVEAGLVASLARPGGNLTGLSVITPEFLGKRLQLFKEAVPGVSRVAVLWNAATPGARWRAMQPPARALGMALQSLPVHGPDDFDRAFDAATRERADAL